MRGKTDGTISRNVVPTTICIQCPKQHTCKTTFQTTKPPANMQENSNLILSILLDSQKLWNTRAECNRKADINRDDATFSNMLGGLTVGCY